MQLKNNSAVTIVKLIIKNHKLIKKPNTTGS